MYVPPLLLGSHSVQFILSEPIGYVAEVNAPHRGCKGRKGGCVGTWDFDPGLSLRLERSMEEEEAAGVE